MFGSDFAGNFGLFGPPWQAVDPQAGLFGPSVPADQQPIGSQMLGMDQGAQPQPPGGEATHIPPAGGAPPVAAPPGVKPPTPPATPDQGPQAGQGNAAAALAPGGLLSGISSEFGKPKV